MNMEEADATVENPERNIPIPLTAGPKAVAFLKQVAFPPVQFYEQRRVMHPADSDQIGVYSTAPSQLRLLKQHFH